MPQRAYSDAVKVSGQARCLAEVLKDRPHAVGAEIGVNHGTTMEAMFRLLPGIKRYYAVDPWENYPGYNESMAPGKRRTQKDFDTAMGHALDRTRQWWGKLHMMRGCSLDVALVIPDDSLDWVFIDGNHAYPYVCQDIATWYPKVMDGGILAGHDYLKRKGWGVIQAVDAFSEQCGWPLHVDAKSVTWWMEVAA